MDDLFFWISGINESVKVEVNTNGPYSIVPIRSEEQFSFIVFYEDRNTRWNRSELFIWSEEEQSLQKSSYTYPSLPELPENWRNFMISYSKDLPVSPSPCFNEYSASKGADFLGNELWLINLGEMIDEVNLETALFDDSTDEVLASIQRYVTSESGTNCQIEEVNESQVTIPNLKTIPPATQSNMYEFSAVFITPIPYFV